MSDDSSNVVPIVSRAGRLADALQRARARQQEQASSGLDALAQDLRAMAGELPAGEAARFALTASDDGQRLTVDDTAHVELYAQRGAYRLVRTDGEAPAVVAETSDREAMANTVADYVAEQILARETAATPVATPPVTPAPAAVAEPPALQPVQEQPQTPQPQRSRFWFGFWMFVLGGVCSATALFTYAWLQVGAAG